MKKIFLLLSLTCTALWAQVPPPPGVPSPIAAPTAPPITEPGTVVIAPKNEYNLSEADLNKVYGRDEINIKEMKIDEFLQIYAETVNRTILRPGTLPAPNITLRNQTPVTRREMIMLLDAVMGVNGITAVPVGDKFVKIVPIAEAGQSGGEIKSGDAKDIAPIGPYITHVVQLKYVRPSEMMPIIAPFAKVQNSILPIEGNGVLVIRDFAENVKRMLEMIAQVDISIPAEFISEVIPIKYALAGDIASVLNSLGGGGGGATVGSSGASASRTTSRAGAGGRSLGGGLNGGLGAQGGVGGANTGALGAATGTAGGAAAGNTFTDRLRTIINRASTTTGTGGGGGDIQIFGQTKVIADERTNSLLVYATREDMARIKDVISKVDVVLAQVLIESIILGVSADSSLDLGVSAAQDAKSLGKEVIGGGVMNNDNNSLSTGLDFLNGAGSNAIPALGGLNYFGNINKDWNVAVKALSSRGKTEVIQRPVIMTTHATPGSFFVGSTVPYVTSQYYGGGYGGGPSSSYQQLRVGIQLTVTPFINPDGIVVMKIDQAIEELDGTTQIQGVGAVPNTASRTLSADVTVRDRDTIVLGGFIRSSGSKSKSGVPLLKDIPVLGQLFSSTSSSKDRKELLVLMRPTVLKTPELAAIGSRIERDRMVGVSRFEKQIEKEDAKYNAEMDKLDGLKPSKTGTNLPPVSSTHEPADPLHHALLEKQVELNSQPATVAPATSAPPVAPAVEAPAPSAPASQPAAQEWTQPTSQNSVKPAADPFKSVQPMTEEEKRAFGRVAE